MPERPKLSVPSARLLRPHRAATAGPGRAGARQPDGDVRGGGAEGGEQGAGRAAGRAVHDRDVEAGAGGERGGEGGAEERLRGVGGGAGAAVRDGGGSGDGDGEGEGGLRGAEEEPRDGAGESFGADCGHSSWTRVRFCSGRS